MIYEFINRTEDFMQSLLHQGSSAPRSLKKFFIYSMSTLKTNRTALSFTFYQFFSLTLIGEQGMAQWWELSPPSSTQPDVYAICGLSLLLVLSLAPRGFSSGTPVFPSPRKPTLSNSNSIWNARTRLNEFMWTPRCFVGKQAINNFFFSEMPGAITMHSLVFRVQVSQFHATFQKLLIY